MELPSLQSHPCKACLKAACHYNTLSTTHMVAWNTPHTKSFILATLENDVARIPALIPALMMMIMYSCGLLVGCPRHDISAHLKACSHNQFTALRMMRSRVRPCKALTLLPVPAHAGVQSQGCSKQDHNPARMHYKAAYWVQPHRPAASSPLALPPCIPCILVNSCPCVFWGSSAQRPLHDPVDKFA